MRQAAEVILLQEHRNNYKTANEFDLWQAYKTGKEKRRASAGLRPEIKFPESILRSASQIFFFLTGSRQLKVRYRIREYWMALG